ncbi:cysteine desulfurase [Strigomonas culicis]|uniref:cysteine desulfurase n=1 Tax=Strigomonas culicis TaxID=28005 RepID=S9TTL4_9TRYP|nr:cysteine desulfurase [Strigomonas culicis]|eukprot:EPY19873.1 cysteine desulfurase [Strigomonas culicis]
MAKNKFPIYMDYSATTPVDPRVVEKMIPWLYDNPGNPASRSHSFGWKAEEAIERAREEVADLVNADPREIIWTSGATESNNLAIKGAANFYSGKGKHIITIKTEHKAVLDTCRNLEKHGFDVSYLNVMSNGLLDLDYFKDSIRKDTILASVMLVNNEIGIIQDIESIGKICRDKGVIFHVDAAQASGKLSINLQKNACRFDAFSAHKVYGPKGIGALYICRKPRVRVEAQIHGGGHERGLRSGTLATHQIVGMGEAFRIAKTDMNMDNVRIASLRDKLWAGISDIEDVYINGSIEHSIPHNLNVSFNYVEGESLIMALKNLAVSSGSACTSASLEPSYVLRALGRSDELAHSSIRFTLGRFSCENDIAFAIQELNTHVSKLREMSPLWEMVKSGIDLESVHWSSH